MSAMTNYLEQALLNEIFRNTNFVPPNTWVALFTADPTDTGSLAAEVTGGSYARIRVFTDGLTAPFWAAPVDNGTGGFRVQNNTAIDFALATAPWGTITHMAIMDAATPGAGNALFTGALSSPKAIDTNDRLSFPAGSLQVNLT